MPCNLIPMPGGGNAIVCTGRGTALRRCSCGRAATLLCDWKVRRKRSGTCDAPICSSCTTSPAAGKDLCGTHATDYRAWQSARAQIGGVA